MADKMVQDDILPVMKIKSALAHAEKEKIGCALAMTKDKQVVLFVDKRMKPRTCAKELQKHKDQFDPTTLRFGEVDFDEANPTVVRFNLNRKEASGAQAAMNKLVKRAGYSASIFVENTELENSPEAGETPVPPAPPPPSLALNMGALKMQLKTQVQRLSTIVAGQPQLKASLLELAKNAQVHLAGTDYAAAIAACDSLQRALDTAADAAPSPEAMTDGVGENGGPGENDGPAVALAKSSKIWRDCRASLNSKLGDLKQAILAVYADEPAVKSAIEQNMGTLDAALDGLDDRLGNSLDAALIATDPVTRDAHVQHSKAIIADYIRYVASNQQIAAIDGNPFGVEPGLRDTLTKTLGALVALSKTVR